MPLLRRRPLLAWAIALLLLAPGALVGCAFSAPEADHLADPAAPPAELDAFGGGAAQSTMRAKASEAMNERAAAPSADEGPAGAAKPEAEEAKDAPNAAQGRELIRRAELNLSVPVVADAAASVQAMARRMGGFVGDMRWEAAEGGRPSAQLTVRVPAARFDAFVEKAGGVGRLEQKVISAEDVTAEVVDSKARVRNLKAEENRLVELLKRAGKLSEVLEVEREISRVRGEVEQIQARLRELGNLVGLATVTVRLSERLPQAQVGGWALSEAWSSAWREATDDLGQSLRRSITTATRLVVVEAPSLVLALLGAALAYGLALLLALGLLVRRGPRWPEGRARWVAASVGVASLVAIYPVLLAFLALVGAVAGIAVLVRWAWPSKAQPAPQAPSPPAPEAPVGPPLA